jgi:hypothetical protein
VFLFPPSLPLRHTTLPGCNYLHSALGSYFKVLLRFESYTTVYKSFSDLFGFAGEDFSLFWVPYLNQSRCFWI